MIIENSEISYLHDKNDEKSAFGARFSIGPKGAKHPGWGEGWAGGANLGFALTAGNSETKNLNIGFNAARTGSHDT